VNDFIGRGWSFPIALGADGSVQLVGEEAEIEQAIRIILATAPGERPMRPEFGCEIHHRLFDELNGRTADRVAHDVRRALARWEPRIEVLEVRADRHPDLASALLVEVRYRVRDRNDPRNLVFPFYVIPGEE
jgi:phage baseplate assembly protein W